MQQNLVVPTQLKNYSRKIFSECLQFNEMCRVLLTGNLVTLQSIEALIGMLLDASLLSATTILESILMNHCLCTSPYSTWSLLSWLCSKFKPLNSFISKFHQEWDIIMLLWDSYVDHFFLSSNSSKGLLFFPEAF